MPSTQIREALATCAAWDPTAREPDAVLCWAGCAFCRCGGNNSIACPSIMNPNPRGNERVGPLRPSRTTRWIPPDFSMRVIAPVKPEVASSITRPLLAATFLGFVLGLWPVTLAGPHWSQFIVSSCLSGALSSEATKGRSVDSEEPAVGSVSIMPHQLRLALSWRQCYVFV